MGYKCNDLPLNFFELKPERELKKGMPSIYLRKTNWDQSKLDEIALKFVLFFYLLCQLVKWKRDWGFMLLAGTIELQFGKKRFFVNFVRYSVIGYVVQNNFQCFIIWNCFEIFIVFLFIMSTYFNYNGLNYSFIYSYSKKILFFIIFFSSIACGWLALKWNRNWI